MLTEYFCSALCWAFSQLWSLLAHSESRRDEQFSGGLILHSMAIKNTTRTILVAVGLLVVVAMAWWHSNSDMSQQVPSTSIEPYNVKVGDALGVRLGGPFDTFLTVQRGNQKVKRDWIPDSCVQGLDDDVFCSISPDLLKPPAIGDTQLYFCTVQFYQNQAVSVRYTLAGYNREALLDSLQEKFGKPNHSDSDSRRAWTWRNAVSSIEYEMDKKDISASYLTLDLFQKTDELLDRQSRREKAKMKRDL